MQPIQNIIIVMVKVRESCAFVQLENSAAIGEESTLHAYTMPAQNRTTTPMAAYTQRFSLFIFSVPFSSYPIDQMTDGLNGSLFLGENVDLLFTGQHAEGTLHQSFHLVFTCQDGIGSDKGNTADSLTIKIFWREASCGFPYRRF